MAEDNHQPPGLATLAGRVARTGLGALQNRLELFAVEWQEERTRLAGLLVSSLILAFLLVTGTVLLTATIILLFPEDWRIYAAAGFSVLYLIGAVAAWFGLRSLLKHEPFAETVDQVKKDRVWLESLK
ncbi:MAG TPA: phage holin family protein [Clostridia bacterium]|nr:phage holin family protein [Clostridia bacterium]